MSAPVEGPNPTERNNPPLASDTPYTDICGGSKDRICVNGTKGEHKLAYKNAGVFLHARMTQSAAYKNGSYYLFCNTKVLLHVRIFSVP